MRNSFFVKNEFVKNKYYRKPKPEQPCLQCRVGGKCERRKNFLLAVT